MIPKWNFWVSEIFWIYITTMFIIGTVRKLRTTTIKNKKMTITLFVLSYSLCVTISIFHSSFSHQLDQSAQLVRKPPSLPLITKDWGGNFSKEDRTKYSQSLAQGSFVNEGAFRDYIDLNGQLREYEPTKEDRQNHINHLIGIKQIENSATQLFYMSIIWLLVPLFGVGIGFTSWQRPDFSFAWLRKCKQLILKLNL